MYGESNYCDQAAVCTETRLLKSGTVITGIAASILALFSLSAFAKERPKETMTVIENESTTTAYDWQMDGKASVSCYGSSCSMYYHPATSGTQNIRGAILRLKRPDDSVVIVQCVGKTDVFSSVVLALGTMATSNSVATTVMRNCRIPEMNSIVDVEFHRSEAKIFMRAPSVDGTGKVSSETYYIKGILKPSTQQAQTPNVSVQSAPENSPTSNLQRLDTVNRRLEEWYLNGPGLQLELNTLNKNCPPPITDEGCFNVEREHYLLGISVFEVGIPLVEEKIALLKTLNQDAAVKREEDEISKRGDGMRQLLLISKARLADLDARLAAVAKPRQVYREQPSTERLTAQLPPSQLSEVAFRSPSPTSGNLDPMRVDKSIVDSHSDSAPVPNESDAALTEKPTKQVIADAQQKIVNCPKRIQIGMLEGDVYSCKGVPAQRSEDQAVYSDGTHVYFDPSTHKVSNVIWLLGQ
jgi:predicted lipoprotein with Yx(FWY)xxD motif